MVKSLCLESLNKYSNTAMRQNNNNNINNNDNNNHRYTVRKLK